MATVIETEGVGREAEALPPGAVGADARGGTPHALQVAREVYEEFRRRINTRVATALFTVLVGVHQVLAAIFYDRLGVTAEEAGVGVARSALDAAAFVFLAVVVVHVLLLMPVVIAAALAGQSLVRRGVRWIRVRRGWIWVVLHHTAIPVVVVAGVVMASRTGSALPVIVAGVAVGALFDLADRLPPGPVDNGADADGADREPDRSDAHRKWFVPVSVVVAVALLIVGGIQAYRTGDAVRRGSEVHGFPSWAFDAQRVNLAPLGTAGQPAIEELAGHCLMLLGQANGTVVLYDVDAQATVRLPSGSVAITDASVSQQC